MLGRVLMDKYIISLFRDSLLQGRDSGKKFSALPRAQGLPVNANKRKRFEYGLGREDRTSCCLSRGS